MLYRYRYSNFSRRRKKEAIFVNFLQTIIMALRRNEGYFGKLRKQ